MTIPGTAITLPAYTVAQLLTLAGLIVLDVLLAVAHALRVGTFDWRKLVTFYERKFVPFLIGWFALRVMLLFVDASQMGDFGQYAEEGVVQLAFARCVWLVGTSAFDNLRQLYSEAPALKAPAAPDRE